MNPPDLPLIREALFQIKWPSLALHEHFNMEVLRRAAVENPRSPENEALIDAAYRCPTCSAVAHFWYMYGSDFE